MCLDLAHNDITDLALVLGQLQQLPKLRALHLKGNPISLLPHYLKAAVGAPAAATAKLSLPVVLVKAGYSRCIAEKHSTWFKRVSSLLRAA
jgi:hypothetical protein